jgi:hypothetical protein
MLQQGKNLTVAQSPKATRFSAAQISQLQTGLITGTCGQDPMLPPLFSFFFEHRFFFI